MVACKYLFRIIFKKSYLRPLYSLAFACHDQGASSVAYAPQHQLLISAGKKGDVCVFDVRQRTLRHRFQVRDNRDLTGFSYIYDIIFITGS